MAPQKHFDSVVRSPARTIPEANPGLKFWARSGQAGVRRCPGARSPVRGPVQLSVNKEKPLIGFEPICHSGVIPCSSLIQRELKRPQ